MSDPYTPNQPKIHDRCPACGNRTLFIGAGGLLTCSVIGCPAPAVGAEIERLLNDLDVANRQLRAAQRELHGGHETRPHRPDGFTLQVEISSIRAFLAAIDMKCSRAIHETQSEASRIIRELTKLVAPPPTEALRLSVTGVVGRRSKPMSVKPVPPLTLSDIERVHLSLAPKLPDGSPDPGPFSWTVDNAAIAQVVGEDGNGDPDPTNSEPTTPNVWLLTPAGPGVVTVTATSSNPDVDGNSIEITITEGRHGDVNLSAGTPVPD